MSNVLSWVLALFIGAVMLFLGGWVKLISAEFMGDTTSITLFSQNISPVVEHFSGLTFMEPWGRRIIGGLEILAGLLVILPSMRMAGAFLSFLITAGAIGTHIAGEFVPDDKFAAGYDFGIGVVSDGAPADYFLFGTAVALFIASIVLMVRAGR